MKIRLLVDLKLEDESWELFSVEKTIELDAVPRRGDFISDNDILFTVESVKFDISEERVDIHLKEFIFGNDTDKLYVLTRMEVSEWFYRDPKVYPLSKQ